MHPFFTDIITQSHRFISWLGYMWEHYPIICILFILANILIYIATDIPIILGMVGYFIIIGPLGALLLYYNMFLMNYWWGWDVFKAYSWVFDIVNSIFGTTVPINMAWDTLDFYTKFKMFYKISLIPFVMPFLHMFVFIYVPGFSLAVYVYWLFFKIAMIPFS